MFLMNLVQFIVDRTLYVKMRTVVYCLMLLYVFRLESMLCCHFCAFDNQISDAKYYILCIRVAGNNLAVCNYYFLRKLSKKTPHDVILASYERTIVMRKFNLNRTLDTLFLKLICQITLKVLGQNGHKPVIQIF